MGARSFNEPKNAWSISSTAYNVPPDRKAPLRHDRHDRDAGQVDTARMLRIASTSRRPLRAEFVAIYRMPVMRVPTIDSSTALRFLPSRRHNRHNDREIHTASDRGSMTIDRDFPMFSCHHLTTSSHPHDHLPEGRAPRPEQCRLILGHHAMT